MDKVDIDKIINGCNALKFYFSEEYDINHVDFVEELNIYFEKFKNDISFRTKENKSLLFEIIELDEGIDILGKKTQSLEDEEDENIRPKNLDVFIRTYANFSSLCYNIREYLKKTYRNDWVIDTGEYHPLLDFEIGSADSSNLEEYPNPKNSSKPNKSLFYDGKELNLKDRFDIAVKVLDIDNKIRRLNIEESEKYKLLARIFNCNTDNARHLMNGKYPHKPRDLTKYFNELGLNK